MGEEAARRQRVHRLLQLPARLPVARHPHQGLGLAEPGALVRGIERDGPRVLGERRLQAAAVAQRRGERPVRLGVARQRGRRRGEVLPRLGRRPG